MDIETFKLIDFKSQLKFTDSEIESGNKFYDIIFPKPIYPGNDKRIPIKKITPEIEIRDRKTIRKYYKAGIKCFIGRPIDFNLAGIDLDYKSGKDGISLYTEITGKDPRNGFYVLTPNNGIHKYFYTTEKNFVSCEIASGIENKSKAFICLPLSRTSTGLYRPQGNPSRIELLPECLSRLIPQRKSEPIQPQNYPVKSNIGLNKIYEIMTVKQSFIPEAGNRNNWSWNFAKFARKNGYKPDEIKQYLSFLISSEFPERELNSTIQSSFRGVSR